jgi:uncharacterized DUF497 family protein
MTLEFEWDETKNRLNRKKHGIWFEEAQTVFDDPLGRLFRDEREIEERYILIGTSRYSQVLVVVHCYRSSDSQIRIISARRATKRERDHYEKRI